MKGDTSCVCSILNYENERSLYGRDASVGMCYTRAGLAARDMRVSTLLVAASSDE
jgi:hypothetical protein